MPCGSVPAIAALTRSGARKESEIAMFTLRAVQPSRCAIVSAVAVGSMTSSSSQRRPRAMEASKVVRFSERIRRAFCGESPSGRRISRRRVAAAFCQRTLSVFSGPARSFSARSSCANRTINRSGCTSTTLTLSRTNSAANSFKGALLDAVRRHLATSTAPSARPDGVQVGQRIAAIARPLHAPQLDRSAMHRTRTGIRVGWAGD
jgi:hypothetical protein